MRSRSPSWRWVETEFGLASKHPNISQSIPALRHLPFRIRVRKSLKWKPELRHLTVCRRLLECRNGSSHLGSSNSFAVGPLDLTGIIRISCGIDGNEGKRE